MKLGPETKETALGLLKKFGLYEVEKKYPKELYLSLKFRLIYYPKSGRKFCPDVPP